MGVFDDAVAERQAPQTAAKPSGDVFEQAAAERATPEEIESARPKNALELTGKFLKNAAVGALKIPLQVVGGIGGLIGKLSDATGNTSGMEKAQQEQTAGREAKLDSTLGTQPGLSQMTGNIAGTLALPIGGVAEGPTALLKMFGVGDRLAGAGGAAVANAGVGAIEGENSGKAGLGASVGLAGTALGELLKAGGGQVIKSYIKGGHKGAAEGLDIPWVINKELGGSQEQMTRNAEEILQGLRGQQNQIVAQKGTVPIDGLSILHDIENNINSFAGIAKNAGSESVAQNQLNKYFDSYSKIADQNTGAAPLSLMWEFKKKAANDAADLYKAARIGGDVKSKVAQGVSAMVAEKINDAMSAPGAAPELAALNPEFTKVIPFAKALARRNVIAGQHNPLGLDELAALEAGTNFMTHGHWEGGLLPVLQKLSKSPYAGQKLRQAGSLLENPRGAAAAADATTNLVNFMQGGQQQEGYQ